MKINEHNYQSYLLDYVDGELPEAEQQALLRYMADHPEVAEQLELLQKTKLQAPERVVFPDKTTLYRTAAQPKKPLRMIWKRWMAGAAALLLLLIVTRLYLQQDTTSAPPVSNNPALATQRQEQPVASPLSGPRNDKPQQQGEQKTAPNQGAQEQLRPPARQPKATAPALAADHPARGAAPGEETRAEVVPIPDRPVPPDEPDVIAPEWAATSWSPTPDKAEMAAATTGEVALAQEQTAEETPPVSADRPTNQHADALFTRSLQKLQANKESLDSSFTDKVLALQEKLKHPMKALNIKKISIGNVSFVFN